MTRATTIGASSAAAALGLSPFESPLELWHRLTGRTGGPVETPPMLRGQLLEPGLRQWYANEVGAQVFAGPTLAEPGWRVSEYVHARWDAWHIEPTGVVDGEIKSVNQWASSKWEDGVPVWYLIQALIQLAAQHPDGLTCTRCDLVAYVTDSESPVIHPIARDDRRMGALVERVDRWFRDYVIADTPPPPRTDDERRALLATIAPTEEWVTPTDEDRVMVARLAELRRMEKAAKAEAETITATLLDRVGTAAGLDGLVRGSFVKGRTTIDARALKKAHPDIYAAFARTGLPHRQWRIIANDSTDTPEE